MNLPFHIAKHLNVVIVYESLGEIAGYYHKIEDQKIIHVDETQSEWAKTFVVRNFLPLAMMHSDEFCAILKREIRFSIEQVEQTRTG